MEIEERNLVIEGEEEADTVANEEPIPVSERRLVTQPVDLAMRNLFDMVNENSLVLQPTFQRRNVWDNRRASKLIESILMNVPLPLVYLSEDETGQYSVIDGQQRITSIVKFMKNELELRGLTVLPELNGKHFQDLERRDQQNVRSRTMRCIVITPESNPEIKFEIFERLNSGAVQLNQQELRNSIYRGDLNNLLKELVKDSQWLQCLDRKEEDPRMRDCEMILRFFALFDNYNKYTRLKKFLNDYMAEKRHMSEAEKNRLTELFRRTVGIVYSVFGDKAFRRYRKGNAADPNGTWENSVNVALFDVVMVISA